MPLYPLKFKPILVPKPWGGRRIASLNRDLPDDESTLIGESWELADLPEQRSVVANGPLAGRTLHDVIRAHQRELLSGLDLSPEGGFPLLVKYLDAARPLSVQVHPDEEYVRRHPHARLKSEALYIVEAEPNAVIYRGLKPGVTREQFVEHVRAGHVVEDLIAVPVKAGQCLYIPSGTAHAYGAGILAVEVQTSSDTTYRIWDWERTDREMHLDEAVECLSLGEPDVRRHERRTHVAGMFSTMSRICTCEHFTIEKVRMVEEFEEEIPYDYPAVWVVLEGRGVITGTPAHLDVEFERGDVLLIPAEMSHARVRLSKDTVWLDVQFPKSLSDLRVA